MNRYPADTYAIVRAVLERGNQPGLITEWFAGMKAWADANQGPDAAALRLWLPQFPIRPFYTAEELARLWPALKLTLGLAKTMTEPPTANRLENELLFCGLPMLVNYDTGNSWFWNPERTKMGKYFVVEHVHDWKNLSMSQGGFDNVFDR